MNPIYRTNEVETAIAENADIVALAHDLERRLNQATELIEYFRCSSNHDALDAYVQIRAELGMGPFEGDALERITDMKKAFEKIKDFLVFE
jgi:hypothetical protein